MIEKLADPVSYARLREKLVFLAWHKYRIRREDAGDIFQSALATYFEVRERYEGESNQGGILVGIFNNKCLEHIDRSVRERKRLKKLMGEADPDRRNAWIDPDGRSAARSVLEQLVNREDRRGILEAIDELRPEAREMFRLLVEEGLGRRGLIEHYDLNKNTLDTRLHVFRRELRKLLRDKGVLR